MSTPAGLPSWTRTATIEYYGGHPDKQNYMGQGAIDARTDVTAEQLNRLAADLAACVRVAPFCVILLTTNDTTPGPPFVQSIRMQNRVNLTGYAGDNPPPGFPVCLRTGNGRVSITFPVSPEDDFGQTIPVDLKAGLGGVRGIAGDVWVSMQNPNADAYYEALDVKATDEDGVALEDVPIIVEAW